MTSRARLCCVFSQRGYRGVEEHAGGGQPASMGRVPCCSASYALVPRRRGVQAETSLRSMMPVFGLFLPLGDVGGAALCGTRDFAFIGFQRGHRSCVPRMALLHRPVSHAVHLST